MKYWLSCLLAMLIAMQSVLAMADAFFDHHPNVQHHHAPATDSDDHGHAASGLAAQSADCDYCTDHAADCYHSHHHHAQPLVAPGMSLGFACGNTLLSTVIVTKPRAMPSALDRPPIT